MLLILSRAFIFYERGNNMKEIITIQISKFLTNDYVKQIGLKQWGVQTPATVNRSRHYIFDEIFNDNECFGVIATNSNDEIVEDCTVLEMKRILNYGIMAIYLCHLILGEWVLPLK